MPGQRLYGVVRNASCSLHCRVTNLLLEALPQATREALQLEEGILAERHILFKPDEIPPQLSFPLEGSITSLVRSTEDGETVEAGIVGSEGAVIIQSVITHPAPTGTEGMVQLAGPFAWTKSSVARDVFRQDERFREVMLAFTNTLMGQMTQNLLCNRLHTIEQRLAKWLLAVRDRIDSDEIRLTHEFLSHMLGIHRPGVSIAIRALEIDGTIAHTRNVITIRDRDALVRRSCECSAVTHDGLETLRRQLVR
jgi:Crp-like helix-turn-helix domain